MAENDEVGMAIDTIRRVNALVIMHENALDELSFALCLGKDENLIAEMLKEGATKKISDGLARLIEQTFSKPNRWLDHTAGDTGAGPSFDLFG